MRVSTSQIYQLGVDAMNRRQAELLKTQQQAAAGRRILTPSDDPVAAAQALSVEQAKGRSLQYTANIASAQDNLNLSESLLGQVTTLIEDVRTQAIAAGNPAMSDADRRAIATDVAGKLAHLVGLANSRDADGGFLFAGFRVDTQPFSTTASGVAYNGDEGQRSLEVGPGRTLAISDNGRDVFERIPSGNGTFVVSAAASNAGTGTIDNGIVTNTASLTGHSYALQFSVAGGVTTYDVVDLTTSTAVSTGNAYTAGSTIAVAGMQVTVSGAPAAGDQYTLAPASSQSLFTTLQSLVDTLGTPAGTPASRTALANALTASIANIDQGLEHVLTVRASVGARLNELDALQSGHESRQLGYDATLSKLNDLDYNQALSDFARQQLALQAAQKTFAQVSKLSLFDYL